jgi:hypothetical protein
MVQKLSFFLIVLTITGCSPYVTDFSGSLIYKQNFRVLNDSIPENIRTHYEERYTDTIELCVLPSGAIEQEYTSGYLGLDFMANVSDRKRSANGFKGVDTILVRQYVSMKDDLSKFQMRSLVLTGSEGVIGDSTYDFHYKFNYHTIKDSLYFFQDFKTSFRDFYFGKLLTKSRQLPVSYSIQTADYEMTRNLISVWPSDSAKTVRLNRKLKKLIP